MAIRHNDKTNVRIWLYDIIIKQISEYGTIIRSFSGDSGES